jgi:hypothetical protein
MAAVAAVVGNPGRRVLAVRQAAVAAAATADDGNHAAQSEPTFMSAFDKQITDKILEDGMSFKQHRTAFATRILLALLIPLAACNNKPPDKPSTKVFASPDEASDALMAAAKSGDPAAAEAIFGPDSKDLMHSADPVADKSAIASFVAG